MKASAWKGELAHVPTWALEHEIERRNETSFGVPAIEVGDLIVDPIASIVRWRGDDYVIAGRKMEVLYALAVAWMQGRKRMRTASLARMVWRAWDDTDATNLLQVSVFEIRRLIPGLIVGGRPQGTGYYLAIEPSIVARRREAA